MSKSTARVAELYELRRQQVKQVGGHYWLKYQQATLPLGPINNDYSLTNKDYQSLLKSSKSLMVQTTQGFQKTSEWYAVTAQSFTELSDLSASTRSKIRRGLKRCRVEQVDANYLAKHGYETYITAFKRYENPYQAYSEKEFQKHILEAKHFDDVVEYFAAFYEDRIVAWSSNLIYDNQEANYTAIKFHPDYLKHYSSYALIYQMNESYLKSGKVRYVNDGFRSLIHETNVQTWLIDKFAFEKTGLGLDVYYHPVLNLALKLGYPLKTF